MAIATLPAAEILSLEVTQAQATRQDIRIHFLESQREHRILRVTQILRLVLSQGTTTKRTRIVFLARMQDGIQVLAVAAHTTRYLAPRPATIFSQGMRTACSATGPDMAQLQAMVRAGILSLEMNLGLV